MSRPFKRSGGRGRVEVRLDPDEREVLARLCEELAGMLDAERDEGPSPLADLPGGLSGTEAQLFAQLRGLGGDEPVDPPTDPVLARLLPDAVRDDDAAAGEFRRLTEAGLRTTKAGHLRVTAGALRRPGGSVRLDETETQSLLKGLNDVRLALGEVLGLRSDADAELMEAALDAAESAGPGGADRLGVNEQWVAHARIYEVLGYWQSALLDCLID